MHAYTQLNSLLMRLRHLNHANIGSLWSTRGVHHVEGPCKAQDGDARASPLQGKQHLVRVCMAEASVYATRDAHPIPRQVSDRRPRVKNNRKQTRLKRGVQGATDLEHRQERSRICHPNRVIPAVLRPPLAEKSRSHHHLDLVP